MIGLLVLALSLPWAHAALNGNEIWQEKAYIPGMAAISCGVLTALLLQHRTLPKWTTPLLAVFSIIGLLATFFYADVLWKLIRDHAMLLLCLSAASWLAAMRDATSIAPYGTRWLARMGQWSYEIYLSHMFVVLTATSLYQKMFGTNLHWTFVAYIPVIVICVWIGGWLHRQVSNPATTWISTRTFSATKKDVSI